MGLQIVRLCVLAGLRVAACDPKPGRRQLAIRFGATLTVPNADDLAAAVRDATDGRCADSGFPPARLRLLCRNSPTVSPRAGGAFSSRRTRRETASLTAQAIHHRRLTLVGSRWIRDHGAPRFDLYARAANLLATNLVDVAALEPLHVRLEELAAAMQAVHERSALKAVVLF